ncbi:hypothetical protein H0H87_007475, partial [Tephrocybe sp. NHM501043]
MAPAARTLASVSGRSVVKKDVSTASPEQITCEDYGSQRPRKHVKKLKDDPPAAKTETVYSDDPAPASSGFFCPSIPKFSLEKSFPSILSTLRFIRALEGAVDADGLRPLCEVFFSCLDQIVSSMADLPHGVRYEPEYEVAHFAVTHAETLLRAVVSPQVEAKKTTPSDYTTTLKHVELVVTTLRTFLSAAERALASSKPLPELPELHTQCLPLSPVQEDSESLLDVVEELKKSEVVIAGFLTSQCQDETADASDDLASRRKSQYGTIISKVVRRRATTNGSLAPQFDSYGSTPTLVDPKVMDCADAENSSSDPLARESFLAEIKQKLEDMPYLPRRSAIYILADPYNPEEDVDMPLPSGDAFSVRLDHNGVVKAASLTALVRILTSIDGVLDQDFIPMFFVCFRFFTTPSVFLDALIQRFDETAPAENLTALQLEVWVKSRVNDQIRVAKTVYLWLDLYWKPDADGEVLSALQEFALDRLVGKVPQKLADDILTALNLVGGDVPFCRRSRKAHDLNYFYHQGGRVVLPPNNYIDEPDLSLPVDGDTDQFRIALQLLQFNTPSGKEEFARQLTLHASKLFRQVDPEDAIKYWDLKEQSSRKEEADTMEVSLALKTIIESERALCSWVTFSVLDEHTPRERKVVLEFWLDISARCIRLRNYSSAQCILVGLSNGAITRLKRAVLLVNSASKLQFHVLQNLFVNNDNFTTYREMLHSVEPTVPMLAPLIRDVVSSLGVVPTSLGATEDPEEEDLINLCAYRVVLKTVRAMESCLIPYDIAEHAAIQTWLTDIFGIFPSELEEVRNDKFYYQSKCLDSRDEDFNHVEPWNFTIEGPIYGQPWEYTLSKLPPLPK